MSSFESLLPEALIRGSDRVRKAWWSATGKRVFGAGVLLQDEETSRILALRNTYGDTAMWALPGGGLPRDEQAMERLSTFQGPAVISRFERTARREMREEVGIDTNGIDLSPLAVSIDSSKGFTDLHVVFSGIVTASAVVPYIHERSMIREVAWKDPIELAALPAHHALAAALQKLN